MHKYRVVECWADESRIALQCHLGRYHVALALNGMPLAEGTLHGQKPHSGFVILLCAMSGGMFRLIFESINLADLVSRPIGLQCYTPPFQLARLGASSACN